MAHSLDRSTCRELGLPKYRVSTTLVSWLLIVVMPVVFIGLLIERVIREDRWSGRLAAERQLMAQMKDFVRDLEPDRVFQQVLDRMERELNFPDVTHRPLKAMDQHGYPDPDHLIREIPAIVQKRMSAAPLILVCVGADYEKVAVHTDPRFFADQIPPSATAWRQVFYRFSGGEHRRPVTVDHRSLERLRSRFAAPEQRERLKDFTRKFLVSVFDEYVPETFLNGQPVSFFSARFGLGRFIAVFRMFAGSPAREEPFLGGYFLVVRDADVPRDLVLSLNLNEQRRWFTASATIKPEFRETETHLEYVFPAPPALFPIDPLKGETGARHLVTLLPKHLYIPGLSQWDRVLKAAALLWLILGWVALQRIHQGRLSIPLQISGQLRLGLTLMVLLSLGALWLFGRSFSHLLEKRDEQERLKQFDLELDLLESQAHEQLAEKLRRVWEYKNAVGFDHRASASERQKLLDDVLNLGDGVYAHLISRQDEWIRTRFPDDSAPSSSVLKRVGDIVRVFALHQFITYDQLHRLRGEVQPFVPEHRWGKDLMILARDQVLTGEMPYLMAVDAQPIDIRSTGLAEGKVTQFQFRAEPASGVYTLEAVLFLVQRSDRVLDGFFTERWEAREWFQPPTAEKPLRTAVFGMDTHGLDLSRCWPPDAGMNAELIHLARRGIETARGGSTVVERPHPAQIRTLRKLPYVAVCVQDERHLAAMARLWAFVGPVFVLIWLTTLVTLSARFLARGFLLPIQRLAGAARDVAAGDYRQAVIEERSGPEFLAIGQEFNRMTTGLREGRLLARFVSSQATVDTVSEPEKPREMSLGGDRRTVIVMFSHIADFVRVSSGLNPHQIMELLNNYFSTMEPIIEAHGGVIDKYIGEAIMAVFPAGNDDRSSKRALDAACDMRRALKRFNDTGQVPALRIRTGIGMAEGEVIAGRIGSRTRRLDFTVIGDVVNLAARLEALRDTLPPDAIIMNETLAQRVRSSYDLQKTGNVTIKGKLQNVPVYYHIPMENRS